MLHVHVATDIQTIQFSDWLKCVLTVCKLLPFCQTKSHDIKCSDRLVVNTLIICCLIPEVFCHTSPACSLCSLPAVCRHLGASSG